jgi:hypothetical protein
MADTRAFQGYSINGSGTRIATARRLDGVTPTLTNLTQDTDTLIALGSQWITIKDAIAMGVLDRIPASNTLVELFGPAGFVWK